MTCRSRAGASPGASRPGGSLLPDCGDDQGPTGDEALPGSASTDVEGSSLVALEGAGHGEPVRAGRRGGVGWHLERPRRRSVGDRPGHRGGPVGPRPLWGRRRFGRHRGGQGPGRGHRLDPRPPPAGVHRRRGPDHRRAPPTRPGPHRHRCRVGLLAVCGLAELAGGSPKLTASTSELSAAGGWVGAAVGRPLQLGLGTAGAVVVLVALACVGVVLSTGVSLGAIGRALMAAVAAVGRTVGRWWAGGMVDHADLEPAPPAVAVEAPAEPAPWTTAAEPTSTMADTGETPAVASDATAGPETAGEARRRSKTARPEAPVAPGGEWLLPEMALLKRSGAQRHDERQLELAGEALVASLGAHGVDTRLRRAHRRADGHPLRARARSGVKVARVTSLVQGHRLCHGVARRAHPGPDPGEVGHRGRGPQPPAHAGVAGRHPRRPRPARPTTRSRSLSAGTSPGGR